ncbi:hypothetical protein [Vibrio atypicus]|uniref:hypothetical protein n=1 Tax=Vibrio atypicus TaxID=558271 RepID=UPI00135B6828|nr:hypothetical protein [Vibrio atypicus]
MKKLILVAAVFCLSLLGTVRAADGIAIESGKTTIKQLTESYGEPKEIVTIDEVKLLIYPYDEQHDITFTFSNEVLVEYQLAKWDVDGEVTVTPIN